ncbi:hypothetical protein Ahy_B07g088924 isoform I [Arachis hypogaea]|uniref:Uncharacterized protein n=1 Tax=Arachis hypogaea TaxID=3818 RepID=A0A444YFX0_ARAHY|nr:hypothetical protein Ahy_B07g088924 isoform I [Arachis hypogaea]
MFKDAKKSAILPDQLWYKFQRFRYLESLFGLKKKASSFCIVLSKGCDGEEKGKSEKRWGEHWHIERVWDERMRKERRIWKG